MKIREVKLTNYAQHESLEIEIESDFIGIVGENGSGKSNFINSFSDAISGEFHKKKSLIVTHGQKNGNIFLRGEFDPGEIFTLNKPFPTGDTILKIGEKELVGADPVCAKILEKLDCDKSFLKNMVFVKQEEILGILFGGTAERNKLLQKFFGLERAQKVDLALTSWLSTIPESVEIDESAVREEMRQTEATIAELKSDISEMQEELELAKHEIEQDEPIIEKVEVLYDRAKAYERSSSEISRYTKEKKDLKKKLDNLIVPSVTAEELLEWKDEQSNVKEKIASFTDMQSFLNSAIEEKHSGCEDGTCAVCGSKLDKDSLDKILKRIDFIDKELETLVSQKSDLYIKIKAKTSELDEYLNEQKNLIKRLDYVDSQLDALNISSQGGPTKRSAHEYKDAIDKHTERKINASNCEARIGALGNSLNTFNATLARCKATLVRAENTRRENDALRAHKQKIIRLQGLFKHNGSATEIYVNTKMKRMCSCINEYLAGFSSSYKVKVNRDNEFICQFPGKTILAGELSGGQKVVLSLAFRFAACEVFASKTNLIVLDEPTTWLDKKRIASFGEILSTVKSMSQRKHLQVFVVTHEHSLMPNFDQVIEF